jgi:hypothetical protein
MSSTNEIIWYQSYEIAGHIEVRLEDETVRQTQAQMSTLFNQTKQNISLHINNCFKEGELELKSVVKESLTTAVDGKKYNTKWYNLDTILSVGYRVNSKQGTQFRIWATNVLRDYLLKGYALNQRIDRIENNFENLSREVNKISLQLKIQELPNQGIFFEGQVFDAYVFVADIIKKAKTDIILIDNYVDETVLYLLVKRPRNVTATIYTKTLSKQFQLDLTKHNSQYPEIQVIEFSQAHDRFLIIDGKELYHIGASLKDLGKKCLPSGQAGFAFSRMDSFVNEVLLKLNKGGKDE